MTAVVSRQDRLNALADLHEAWVAKNLVAASKVFDPSGRRRGSDYNLHHVDVDADGGSQDGFDAAAAAIFALAADGARPSGRSVRPVFASLVCAHRQRLQAFDPAQLRDERGRWAIGELAEEIVEEVAEFDTAGGADVDEDGEDTFVVDDFAAGLPVDASHVEDVAAVLDLVVAFVQGHADGVDGSEGGGPVQIVAAAAHGIHVAAFRDVDGDVGEPGSVFVAVCDDPIVDPLDGDCALLTVGEASQLASALRNPSAELASASDLDAVAAAVGNRSPRVRAEFKELLHRRDRKGKFAKVSAAPTVVSKKELDDLVAGGSKELFRGVGGSSKKRTGAFYAEQFRTGPFYFGTGMFGNGTYTTDKRDRAEYFVEGEPPGGLMRMVMHPDARILTGEELGQVSDRYHALYDSLPDNSPAKSVFEDFGRYAAALGYDAVYHDPTDVTVILNRTAVIVQEAGDL